MIRYQRPWENAKNAIFEMEKWSARHVVGRFIYLPFKLTWVVGFGSRSPDAKGSIDGLEGEGGEEGQGGLYGVVAVLVDVGYQTEEYDA